MWHGGDSLTLTLILILTLTLTLTLTLILTPTLSLTLNPNPNPDPDPDQVTLPQPVCELIDVIEHFTATQVISIGNGPRGDEIIYIKRKEGGKRKDGRAKAK